MADENEIKNIGDALLSLREAVLSIEKKIAGGQVQHSNIDEVSKNLNTMAKMVHIMMQKLEELSPRREEDQQDKEIEENLFNAFEEYIEVHQKRADLKMAKHFRR